MTKWRLLIIILALSALGYGIYTFLPGEKPKAEHAEEGHDEEGHGEEGHAEEESGERARISDESAKLMGIETVTVGASSIRETKSLSGRIVLNQNSSAQVKARYAGIVRKVFKQAGETVKRGEKLATVESNESLQTYAVPSPLDGVVLERHISMGDETGEEPIFVVADLTKLWAEFFVFAGDAGQITQGQQVTIATLDSKLTSESTILAVLPTADSASQTVVARAEIDNSTGQWRSGMTVRVDAVLTEKEVPVAVPTASIQHMEGQTVVFVKDGEEYVATPVTLGTADRTHTEITAGLEPGVEVVSKNSFVVKADIGKAGAEHEH